jgi:hypothetical protein
LRAGIGSVTSTPKSLAVLSKAWKSAPTAPRMVWWLGTGLSADAPGSPLSPLGPAGSWPALKSLARSDRFFTFDDVIALARILGVSSTLSGCERPS